MWMCLGALVALLVVLYNASAPCRYYMRISFFYACILLHGMECCITCFPSYLNNEGADLIFHKFYYWCWWTGIRVQVRGCSNLDHVQGPAVVIANHQSSLDVVGMTNVWPHRGVVMMKKSLMYIPFFNLASYWVNTIFIDRFNKDKAMQSVDHCVEQLRTKNLKLWVFPEGTRNRNGGLMPFKKGAFNIAVRAGIPIVPIVFSNYKPFYSKNERYFLPGGEVIAQVLPPIQTTGIPIEDVGVLAESTREKMIGVYDKISEEAKQLFQSKRIA